MAQLMTFFVLVMLKVQQLHRIIDSDVWTLELGERSQIGARASDTDGVSGVVQAAARVVDACAGCGVENKMQH